MESLHPDTKDLAHLILNSLIAVPYREVETTRILPHPKAAISKHTTFEKAEIGWELSDWQRRYEKALSIRKSYEKRWPPKNRRDMKHLAYAGMRRKERNALNKLTNLHADLRDCERIEARSDRYRALFEKHRGAIEQKLSDALNAGTTWQEIYSDAATSATFRLEREGMTPVMFPIEFDEVARQRGPIYAMTQEARAKYLAQPEVVEEEHLTDAQQKQILLKPELRPMYGGIGIQKIVIAGFKKSEVYKKLYQSITDERLEPYSSRADVVATRAKGIDEWIWPSGMAFGKVIEITTDMPKTVKRHKDRDIAEAGYVDYVIYRSVYKEVLSWKSTWYNHQLQLPQASTRQAGAPEQTNYISPQALPGETVEEDDEKKRKRRRDAGDDFGRRL